MIDSQKMQAARIMAAEDDEDSLLALQWLLRDCGYPNFRGISDPRHALSAFSEYKPDLLILDLCMPHIDGLAVLRQIKARIPAYEYMPVLVVTGDASTFSREEALSKGANDFVTKPYESTELHLRVANLLRTRFLYLELQEQKAGLEEEVRRRTQELEDAQVEILERLALAAEYRDDDTGRHTKRVGAMSALIAHHLGLPEDEVELIRRAAPLHDVGKVAIPDSILLKRGKLSDEEFAAIKEHTTIGALILSAGSSRLLQMAEEIALTHHERYDGSGYAPGLAGESIPLVGRIVAVADVFDALTNERPYKKAWPVEEAVAEIESQSGRQFDPNVVQAFLQAIRSEDRLAREYWARSPASSTAAKAA